MKKVRIRRAAVFLSLGVVVLLAAACDPYFPFTSESEDTPAQEISPLLVPRPVKSNFKSGDALDPDRDIEVNKLTENGSMTRLNFNAGEFTVTLTRPDETTEQVPAGEVFSFDMWGDWTVAVRTEDLAAWTYPIAVSDDSHLLKVAELKTSYQVNERIDPVNDLAVYKAGAGGEMIKQEYSASGTGFHLEIITESGGDPIPIDPASYVFSSAGPRTVMVKDNQKEAASYIYGITVSDGVSADNYEPLVQVVPRKTVDPGTRIDSDRALEVYIQNLTAGGMEKIPAGTGPKQFSISPETVPADAYGPVEIAVTVHGYPGSADETTVTCTLFTMTKGAVIEPQMQVIPYKTMYPSTEAINTTYDLAVYIRDTTTGETIQLDSGKFTVEPAGALGAGNNPRTVTVTAPDYPAGIKTERSYNVWVDTQTASVTPTLLAVPIRKNYAMNEKIMPGDLLVYKSAGGGMTPLDYVPKEGTKGYRLVTGSSEVNPAETAFANTGTAMIRIIDNAVTNKAADVTYEVTVGEAHTSALQVIPGKIGYNLGERIVPATELTVFKISSGGMTRLSHLAKESGFTLVRKGTTIDPATTSFNTVGPVWITVKDSSEEAAPVDYQVTVSQAGIYTVTFNKNTADRVEGMEPPNLIVAHGQKITAPAVSRLGYDFAGWYRTDDASGPAWDFTTDTVTVNITLYARWNVTQSRGGYGAVRYVDGSDGTLVQNWRGDWEMLVPQDKVIYSVTFNDNNTYYVGRKGNETITLEVNGPVFLRPESGGYIPVSTVAELELINASADNRAKKYRLEADLDLLGGYNVTGRGLARRQWTPIGNASSPFTGEFEGNGKVVSNMCITIGGTGKGFFGYLDHAAIKNFGVAALITAVGSRIGAVAGIVGNESTLDRCYNMGNIYSGEASSDIGGVAGYVNNSTLAYCYNAGQGSVLGTNNTGGVAGYADAGSFMDTCYNAGRVDGTDNIGGVAGYLSNQSALGSCYNAGVVGGYNNIGGVVGTAAGSNGFVFCYNDGTVSGNAMGTNTGGIVGQLTYYEGTLDGSPHIFTSEIYACWNNGNVEGYTNTGGVAGLIKGALVRASYNSGSGHVFGNRNASNLGGIAGQVMSVSSPALSAQVFACYNKAWVRRGRNMGGIAGALSGGSTVRACYVSAGTGFYGDIFEEHGNIVGDGTGGSVISCWWDDTQSDGMGILTPSTNAGAAPFNGAANFGRMPQPLDGDWTGGSWNMGTIYGQLPKLFWE
jgi:uncharacterized repeat protein (TIGR02543 family)